MMFSLIKECFSFILEKVFLIHFQSNFTYCFCFYFSNKIRKL